MTVILRTKLPSATLRLPQLLLLLFALVFFLLFVAIILQRSISENAKGASGSIFHFIAPHTHVIKKGNISIFLIKFHQRKNSYIFTILNNCLRLYGTAQFYKIPSISF